MTQENDQINRIVGKVETSKTFIKMGEHVGIVAERKSQRGIIAKKFMPLFERFESAEFAKQMKKIELPTRTIKVTGYGGEVYLSI